jgi:hypothetical protein
MRLEMLLHQCVPVRSFIPGCRVAARYKTRPKNLLNELRGSAQMHMYFIRMAISLTLTVPCSRMSRDTIRNATQNCP